MEPPTEPVSSAAPPSSTAPGSSAGSEWCHPWFGTAASDVQLTRFWLLRALGFIYVVAFAIVVNQWLPLEGEAGLMPVSVFLERVRNGTESSSAAFWAAPSLFWLNSSDGWMLTLGWLGLVLSLLLVLGWANAPLMFVLWLLYGSFVHVGQTFYSYGWDILLLEAGFLGIFLCAPLQLWPRVTTVPPLPVIWLYRWLTFRLMFGAGLIKIRGDACWRDLTCLLYHYETQPNPNPLSWLLFQAPPWFHNGGVLFNHVAELIVPFGLLIPNRRARQVAALVIILFQTSLILSGNLSFLNWLTIAISLSALDDRFLARLTPKRLRERIVVESPRALSKPQRAVVAALCAVVGGLSLNPVFNMLNPRQRMNASFDPLDLVNTYGAFGTVGKQRDEVIVEGTNDNPNDPNANWKEYEFPCKPGELAKAPCIITPYHYRLTWQLWFAGFGTPRREPWLVHLVQQLLEGSPSALSQLEHNPFSDHPPKHIRVSRYHYQFTHFGERGWWTRQREGEFLPPLSLGDPRLTEFLQRYGWQ